jgi:hypothetical protein
VILIERLGYIRRNHKEKGKCTEDFTIRKYKTDFRKSKFLEMLDYGCGIIAKLKLIM